jgi:hypothetical protein
LDFFHAFIRTGQLPRIFEQGRGEYAETSEGYEAFRSLILKLSAHYGFFYDMLGSRPDSTGENDPHLWPLLADMHRRGIPHPWGEPIRIASDGRDLFGEHSHVHLLRQFVLGGDITPYITQDHRPHYLHNSGYECFTGTYLPLAEMVHRDDAIPLVVPTAHNFYTELCNVSFLADARYDTTLPKPARHPRHGDVFLAGYLEKMGLDAVLLDADFSAEGYASDTAKKAVRAVNFALQFFWHVTLVISGFIDLFGFSWDHRQMVGHLRHHWQLGSGTMARQINPFHLHLLNYVLSTTHMAAYMVTYCIYRDKYHEPVNDTHASVYLGRSVALPAFREFLTDCASVLIRHEAESLGPQAPDAQVAQVRTRIGALLRLTAYFGIGHRCEPIVGKNINTSVVVDFSRSIGSDSRLADLPFQVRHCAQSPLWSFWHTYAGKFWIGRDVNRQIFLGKGPGWKRNRHHPRAWLMRLGYQYSQCYWMDLTAAVLQVTPRTSPLVPQLKRRQKQVMRCR